MEEILKRIILENQEIIAGKTLVSRNYSITETGYITVLTGIRRSGKTYTLYEIARTIEPERVLFLDFEDERLLALNSLSGYDIIIDTYKILYPDNTPILFFDEIQNLNNWHFYLKRLHVAGYKIFVTGSNAHLISREIATYLKGRSLETTIFPFSFREFLNLKNVTFQPKDAIVNQPKILNLFEEYLQYGGFPEVIKVELVDKRAVAKNIYNLLFYKDLVAKYDKNDVLLKLVVNKITENITKDFSITSLANKINTVYKTSVPTVTDYFNILPEPFLTTNIYPFRNSFVKRESKRKTYLADNSFIWLNRVSTDSSRLFENLVFNFLHRKYAEIFYYKTDNNLEVDFFIVEGESKKMIQASYSLENSDTRDREIRALLKAMDEQSLERGYIYTYNNNDEIKINNKTIFVTPLWKEMLVFPENLQKNRNNTSNYL
ncbi:MAG: ATP-binding protein [Bacteroidales bacterium]|nr:ATP-binding protein [Bacteroidales bacterium]